MEWAAEMDFQKTAQTFKIHFLLLAYVYAYAVQISALGTCEYLENIPYPFYLLPH